MQIVAYTLLFISAQGIVNIGSTSDGSVEKYGCYEKRSRGRTTDEADSSNLKIKTRGTASTPVLVRDGECHPILCCVSGVD